MAASALQEYWQGPGLDRPGLCEKAVLQQRSDFRSSAAAGVKDTGAFLTAATCPIFPPILGMS
jgi:hypothetical protein